MGFRIIYWNMYTNDANKCHNSSGCKECTVPLVCTYEYYFYTGV